MLAHAIRYLCTLAMTPMIFIAGCSDNIEEPSPEQPSEQSEEREQETVDEPDAQAEEDPFAIEAEKFNTTETVDGIEVIQNPDNKTVLVNHDYALPDGYEPEDLVVADVRFSFDEDVEKRYLRSPAAEALESLFHAAEEEEMILFAVSGYRSFDRQDAIFANAASERGEEAANETIAYPGNSEHQTGLAMDISSENNSFLLNEEFGETEEGKWVAENAHKHGFIIRYPEGEEEITEISYEPWHLRYVGEETAEMIYEYDITLEEFFERATEI